MVSIFMHVYRTVALSCVGIGLAKGETTRTNCKQDIITLSSICLANQVLHKRTSIPKFARPRVLHLQSRTLKSKHAYL